jgi:hypothetical protein
MKPLILTALVLLCARPAAADTALRVSFVTAIAAHTADITTTAYCLGARTCREVNPVMRWAERRPVALGLTKGALAGALQLVPYTLQKRGHRRAALWFNIGQTLAFTAVAVRNSQR